MKTQIRLIPIEVLEYDEGTDSFKIHVPCSDLGRDTTANEIDVDDFMMPAGLFAHMVGEFGEPAEFLGRTFNLLGQVS